MQVFFKNLLQKLSQGQQIRSRWIRSGVATYNLVAGSWHCHLFGAGWELRYGSWKVGAMGAAKFFQKILDYWELKDV